VHFDFKALGSLGACTVNSGSFNLDERSQSGVACGMEMHVCTVLYEDPSRKIEQSINPSIEKRHQIARPELPSIPTSAHIPLTPLSYQSYPQLFQHLLNKHSPSNIDTLIQNTHLPSPCNPAPHPHLRKRKVRSKQGGIRRQRSNQGREVTYLHSSPSSLQCNMPLTCHSLP